LLLPERNELKSSVAIPTLDCATTLSEITSNQNKLPVGRSLGRQKSDPSKTLDALKLDRKPMDTTMSTTIFCRLICRYYCALCLERLFHFIGFKYDIFIIKKYFIDFFRQK
jgi:hypothetical protein